jgi:hypothetical protein
MIGNKCNPIIISSKHPMNFETFKTTIGYCHINNETVVLSLDHTTTIVSDNFIYSQYGKSIIKILFIVLLSFFSFNEFKSVNIIAGIFLSILSLMYLIDILNFIKKRDYLFKKRISKKTIQKISGEKKNKIEITYLNDKNQIKTISIQLPDNQTDKERCSNRYLTNEKNNNK